MKLKLNQLLLITMIMAPIPSMAFSLEEMACGAKICLSGDGGSACTPFLNKYHSFKVKKYGRTLPGPTKILRKQFLKRCKTKNGPRALNLRD